MWEKEKRLLERSKWSVGLWRGRKETRQRPVLSTTSNVDDARDMLSTIRATNLPSAALRLSLFLSLSLPFIQLDCDMLCLQLRLLYLY